MLTPRDVIKVTKNREEKDRFKFRTLHFPTLHLCNKCNGYESLDHRFLQGLAQRVDEAKRENEQRERLARANERSYRGDK